MPEDSRKGQDKKKNGPKEQRKPRQRHQQAAAEKRVEKKVEEPQYAPKVTVPQKPVYESPPPEFFKNLKRETDEILKITEEENQKYKKKEIQSNWTKYEMPIDTYEEIEEHENMGADYEKLVQASHSIGGHFQFKHEKSWDINTGPSLYDKYFEINMDDLYLSVCTIPFHERNGIVESIFNESDILTMTNRSTRYKQKYFNDKSYSTPETEVQDKIQNILKVKNDEVSKKDIDINIMKEVEKTTDHSPIVKETTPNSETINLQPKEIAEINVETITPVHTEIEHFEANLELNESENTRPNLVIIDGETNKNKIEVKQHINIAHSNITDESTRIQDNFRPKTNPISELNQNKPKNLDNKAFEEIENDDFIFGNTKSEQVQQKSVEPITPTPAQKVAAPPKEAKSDPVIESPEDLEKWLDDFLDG